MISSANYKNSTAKMLRRKKLPGNRLEFVSLILRGERKKINVDDFLAFLLLKK
jgi:hypothetical protein